MCMLLIKLLAVGSSFPLSIYSFHFVAKHDSVSHIAQKEPWSWSLICWIWLSGSHCYLSYVLMSVAVQLNILFYVQYLGGNCLCCFFMFGSKLTTMFSIIESFLLKRLQLLSGTLLCGEWSHWLGIWNPVWGSCKRFVPFQEGQVFDHIRNYLWIVPTRLSLKNKNVFFQCTGLLKLSAGDNALSTHNN